MITTTKPASTFGENRTKHWRPDRLRPRKPQGREPQERPTDVDQASEVWGIDLAGQLLTRIPTAFWRVYHKVLSREEWLFICHLIAYQERNRSRTCRPRLTLIAQEMGYDIRTAQRLRRGLEKKAWNGKPFLLTVEHVGEANEYDFSGLIACLEALSAERSGQENGG